ncbi:FAD-dependent oxidoreductase [Paenarthrobacter sp. Z7-10]|nr:FAD-dependent oxidoreductase [Paenarthrobacter sp. Z7-10]
MGSMHLNLEAGDPAALAAFYQARVRGGAGLIITGGAAVSRVGAGGASYTLINEASHWPRWQQVVRAVHQVGGLIGLQLFHAGRYAFKSSFGLQPVAPSAVYSRFSRTEPAPLDEAGIAATLADFASAALAAAELGFDAVEIMASEGYLLNQFASPLTNHREDAWGGDATRRRAFPAAVVAAVRQTVPEMPLLVRLSGHDLMPGSSPPEDVDALAVELVRAGADAVDVGIGWHESRIPTVQSLVPHGAWVQVADRIKNALVAAGADVPVIGANRINTVAQAEDVLRTTSVDLVSMARPFLADPAVLAKSFAGLPLLVNTCIGCNEACIDRSLGDEPVSCLVNPRAGRELEFSDQGRDFDSDTAVGGADAVTAPDGAPGPQHDDGPTHRTTVTAPRIGVIGAGPAGMEAARALAANGATVTLWEAGPRIGGQFLLAGQVPGKADFLQTVRYFETELARLGVRVEVETTIDSPNQVVGYDHVIVAAGVRPRPVNLPGLPEMAGQEGFAEQKGSGGQNNPAPRPRVLDYAQAFARLDLVGPQVAIIGAGGIAVDLAHLLATGHTDRAAITIDAGEIDAGESNAGTINAAPRDAGTMDAGERGRFLIEHGLRVGALPPPLRQVTILRRSGPIGAGMGISTRWAAVQAIRTAGVRTLTDISYDRVDAEGVWIRTASEPELIAADTVIIAAGQEPSTGPAQMLAAAGVPHTVIGGAQQTSGMNAVAAFEQGLREGTRIALLAVSGQRSAAGDQSES